MPLKPSLFFFLILWIPFFFPFAWTQTSQPTKPDFVPSPPQNTTEIQKRRMNLIGKLLPKSVFFLVRRPNDTEYFLPDKHFYYLSNTTDANLVMVLLSEPNASEHLFLPKRNAYMEVWDGKKLYPGEEATQITGFQFTSSFGDLQEHFLLFLASLLTLPLENAYYNAPEGKQEELPIDRLIQDFIRVRRLDQHDAYALISQARLVKSQAEIELLQKAIQITGEGLKETMRFAQPGHYEYELRAMIEYHFLKGGARRPGFDSIVGSGPNSCVLHYTFGRRQTESGDLVVMDVGAEFQEYTADVTRTIPINGKFTPRQRVIYQLVLEAQKQAIAIIKPGIPFRQVDQTAREVINKAGYGQYFIHGTSHWLGLNVHDVGDYRSILAPGMVLTVEPGIYLPEENLGVRIEDDVLVTETGCLVLSEHIPREIEAIEALMAE